MKRNTIRILLVLGIVSISGIIITQVYWVRKAFDIKEQEFTVNVSIGLKNVAEAVLKHAHQKNGLSEPVTRLSYKYFVTHVDAQIPPSILDSAIRTEFAKRSITTNFGYVIYDNEKLVYSKCVAISSPDTNSAMLHQLPGWNLHKSYFGVYFPAESSLIFSSMGIWTFSSAVLLLVAILFSYSIFIILKQKRLSEVQRDFVNNMAHEFNTPIASIIASAEVLQKTGTGSVPDRYLQYAGLIRKEATRLNQQVEKVLQIASADKEHLHLQKELVNIHDLLSGICEQVLNSGKGSTAKISCEFTAENPVIHADKAHLASLFSNLLDNAVKYSPKSPEITIHTCNKDKGIEVIMTDNGKGIAKKDIRKIFEKFYRVNDGDIHDVKGFGLGLNYVKNITAAHKGSIFVESEINKGTRFIIFLPYR